MGYVIVTSACAGCGQLMSYHPNRVPSIRLKGVREPVCRACVEAVNPQRIANGLDPIVVRDGAYGAADESEINWGGAS